MHEVSLVSALVDQVQEVSRREGFTRVLEIRVSIGALSGVVPSCVEFCFSEVTRGSVLEGAKLSIAEIPVEVSCRACGMTSFPDDCAALFCSICHSVDVAVVGGRDFNIMDLEVV